MIETEVVEKLREKFNFIHPLIFHRSVERAENPAQLFDILSDIPDNYPLIWDEENRCWKVTDDIFQVSRFKNK